MIPVIATVLAIAGLCYLSYRYRAGLENFIPGLKGKVWNGILAVGSAVSAVVSYLELFDWTKIGLTPTRAAVVGLVFGVVGIVIASVTKRA